MAKMEEQNSVCMVERGRTKDTIAAVTGIEEAKVDGGTCSCPVGLPGSYAASWSLCTLSL